MMGAGMLLHHYTNVHQIYQVVEVTKNKGLLQELG